MSSIRKCHSRESGNPDAVSRIKYGTGSAKAGNQKDQRTGCPIKDFGHDM